jgi:hypothetical protein
MPKHRMNTKLVIHVRGRISYQVTLSIFDEAQIDPCPNISGKDLNHNMKAALPAL